MMTALSKSLMCVQMRSGVEIWVEGERAMRLQNILEGIRETKFIRFENQTFNTADIVGVFEASTMSDLTRRRNGEWRCGQGHWHQKGERCECLDREAESSIRRREEAIRACGKCTGGFIINREMNYAMPCDCQKDML